MRPSAVVVAAAGTAILAILTRHIPELRPLSLMLYSASLNLIYDTAAGAAEYLREAAGLCGGAGGHHSHRNRQDR
jgi:hypothetical protein